MKILITNIHSLENAGDAALLWATIQQLRANFTGCKITLAINFPETFDRFVHDLKGYSSTDLEERDLVVVGSFLHFSKKTHGDHLPGWNIPGLLRLGLLSIWLLILTRLGINRDKLPFGRFSTEQRLLLQAYYSADLVVSVPGNFLYHSGRFGLALLINLYSMVYAPLIGKPLYVFPQSIGPLERSSEKWLTKQVLARARIVMVRERESQRFLEQIGFQHPRLSLIPDVALDFHGFSEVEGAGWLKERGAVVDPRRPRLGITPINWWVQSPDFDFDQQRCYEDALAAVCRFFIRDIGGEVVLFTQVTGDFEAEQDELAGLRVFEKLVDYSEHVTLIAQGALPHLLKAAYSQMDIFIGSRMHSNIFALTSGVPVIAIAYRYKTIGLMKSLGLEHWLVQIDQLGQQQNQEAFIQLVRELWQQASELRPLIQQRVDRLAEQCRLAGKLVAEDFANLAESN